MTGNFDLRLILAANADGLPAGLETGFFAMNEEGAVRSLEAAGLWFGPRNLLETLEAYRQIIPYIVLRVRDRLVRYTRTTAGGESRLHGRMSIGLGGHVDLSDIWCRGDSLDLLNTVNRAAERELYEELGEFVCERRRWSGLLIDNETAVGRVHVGLVGLWDIRELPTPQFEDAVGDVTTASLTELRADAEALERWSALLLGWLESELAPAQTSDAQAAQ